MDQNYFINILQNLQKKLKFTKLQNNYIHVIFLVLIKLASFLICLPSINVNSDIVQYFPLHSNFP